VSGLRSARGDPSDTSDGASSTKASGLAAERTCSGCDRGWQREWRYRAVRGHRSVLTIWLVILVGYAVRTEWFALDSSRSISSACVTPSLEVRGAARRPGSDGLDYCGQERPNERRDRVGAGAGVGASRHRSLVQRDRL
jgi:hypothetical protein